MWASERGRFSITAGSKATRTLLLWGSGQYPSESAAHVGAASQLRRGSVLDRLGDRDAPGDPGELLPVERAARRLGVLDRPVGVEHHPDDHPVARSRLVEAGGVDEGVEPATYAVTHVAGVLVVPVPQHRRDPVVRGARHRLGG